MFKTDTDLNQDIITNGCLQLVYLNGAHLEGRTRDAIKSYTEHLDIFIVFDGEITLKVFNKERVLKAGELFFCTRSTYLEINAGSNQFSCARLRYIKDKLDGHSIQNRFAASLLDCAIIKHKIFNHCLSYISFFESPKNVLDQKNDQMLHNENIEILSVLDIMIGQKHESLEILENQLASVDAVVKAIDIIEANIAQIPKIDKLVSRLGVSHSYFVRIFKRHVGATPNTFSRAVKINYSLSLIGLNMKSLCDISYTLGFCDQSHFCNSFKEYLQFTPRNAIG